MRSIGLTDHISKHFTYREALWLPSWGVVANEAGGLTDVILDNLIIVFEKLDQVRDHFNLPINVHCAFRPFAYNREVGGAQMSPHLTGSAVDFDVAGLDCNKAKIEILSAGLLEALGMRMERNVGNWIHLDTRELSEGGNRFFIP